MLFNCVFVVCHPDDEALWVGGLINALSGFSFLKVHVICLSGADNKSPREGEFHEGRKMAGYHMGVVMGAALRKATEPLPPIPATVEEGLKNVGLTKEDISILITHSPYGDEHRNPHHVQAFKELFRWAKANSLPFGYFSCLPIPMLHYQPMLKSMKRLSKLHLLNFARCSYANPIVGNLLEMLRNPYLGRPKYFLQFLTDGDRKREMLDCYRSVGWESHAKGYAMFTSNCEAIYVQDDRGLALFRKVMEAMETPNDQDLFSEFTARALLDGAMLRFGRLLGVSK